MVTKMPFSFRWCYEPEDEEDDIHENCLLLGTPETVTPLHIDISNILADKTITIHPIEGATEANPDNYHFKLAFNSGILVEPEKIQVKTENWSLAFVCDGTADSLYLLWTGDNISLSFEDFTEIILNGVAAKSAVRETTTIVTISWQLKQGNIDVIDINRLPGQTDEYAKTTTLELEMIKTTGKSNIPLYVGFVGGNKVMNTNNKTSNLQLRITNTNLPGADNADLTFNYSQDASECSQLVLVLEVGTTKEVPWALGTKTQVNKVIISLGEQWLQNGTAEEIQAGEIVKALQWTFIPKSPEVVLKAQETLLINLENIVTAHPTGEANLYLRYQYIKGYKDGQFTCQIEKAPLVFDDKVRVGTNRELNGLLTVKDGISLDHPGEIQHVGPLTFRSDVDNTGDSSSVKFFKKDESNPLMELDSGANLKVVNTLTARKIVGDGTVLSSMILMWSGPANEIPPGWTLCDGNIGTPDLRDKFIVGAGGQYSQDNEGGHKEVTLTVSQMPRHKHSVEDTGHSHTMPLSYGREFDGGGGQHNGVINTSSHKPTNHVKSNVTVLETGSGQSFDNRPPYYALCFIMKIDLDRVPS